MGRRRLHAVRMLHVHIPSTARLLLRRHARRHVVHRDAPLTRHRGIVGTDVSGGRCHRIRIERELARQVRRVRRIETGAGTMRGSCGVKVTAVRARVSVGDRCETGGNVSELGLFGREEILAGASKAKVARRRRELERRLRRCHGGTALAGRGSGLGYMHTKIQ